MWEALSERRPGYSEYEGRPSEMASHVSDESNSFCLPLSSECPMTLLPLSVSCPNCGSKEVTYTCEPKCCFNHLCGTCYATFELTTVSLGTKINGLQAPQGERDCLAPTAACAVCENLDVFLLDEGDGPCDKVYCSSCHSILRLELEAIESA